MLIAVSTLLGMPQSGLTDEMPYDNSLSPTDVFAEIADDFYAVFSATVRVVTAYNAGDRRQTDNTPCIAANGENICAALKKGKKRCAANFVPLGTRLHIDNYGICLVTDRTNRRYKHRVDIAMQKDELAKARTFGRQKLIVRILKKIVENSLMDSN